MRAYRDRCFTAEARADLLAGIRYDGGRKKVGRAVGKVVAALYDPDITHFR